MKTIQYSVSPLNIKTMVTSIRKDFASSLKAFNKNLEHYGNQTVSSLSKSWYERAVTLAMFNQLKEDGLVHISKEEDTYYTFDDHKGDCYCPIVNDNIDPAELKRQERNERARINRQGAWFHTLTVKNVESDTFKPALDAIGGFVGNDFYKSGYDYDFYRTALADIKEQLPEYFNALDNVRQQIEVDDLV